MQANNKRVYIIAEAGVNHNGSPEMALQLIDAAVAAGADAVKFQTFRAGQLVTPSAGKAVYQEQSTGANESQFNMLKRLELSHDSHHLLMRHCQEVGIEFLSSAFDMESLSFLVHELQLQTLKLPSGEITNAPLLLEHARSGRDLIVSTGMATLNEVEFALGVIAFGLTDEDAAIPSATVFQDAYGLPEAQRLLRQKVTLLHCTTEYPAPPSDINLLAMQTMQNAFRLSVGYSDHSEGIAVPIAAVALGARVIEKHFTLDCTLDGPDHKASLEPQALTHMVKAIRAVEAALGNGEKKPMASELANISVVRRSLVAAKDIAQGEAFSEDNLTVKRPGTGISPVQYWAMLGKPSPRDYKINEVISE